MTSSPESQLLGSESVSSPVGSSHVPHWDRQRRPHAARRRAQCSDATESGAYHRRSQSFVGNIHLPSASRATSDRKAGIRGTMNDSARSAPDGSGTATASDLDGGK